MGVDALFDPAKVAVIMDHSSPSPLEGVSALHTMMREFGKKTGCHVYDVGEGVCHQLVPEKGHVVPATSWWAATAIPARTVRSTCSRTGGGIH